MASWLILISAVLFGISPILTKVAYGYGVSPLTVLALRTAFAAVCLWVGLLSSGRRVRVSLSTLAYLVMLGSTLLPFAVFAYFQALAYMPASSASILGYTYPLHVAWMGWLFLRERVRHSELVILAAILFGAVLVARQTPVLGELRGLLVISAATLSFALYLIIARRLLQDVHPLTAMAVLLPVSAAAFCGAALHQGQLRIDIPLPALLATLGSATLAGLIGPLLQFSGLRSTSAARTAMLGMLEPVVTVLLSILLLNDVMTLLRAVGIAIVMGGIITLQLRRPE
jgi:drug/metabolite transporter (DMT)-like permease